MSQDTALPLFDVSARPAHATTGISEIDPTTVERPMRVGSDSEGRCNTCGRYFIGETTFTRHQRMAANGDAICLDPATRGLVIRERRGHQWWGRPGTWKPEAAS
jgi:hypothetical protein